MVHSLLVLLMILRATRRGLFLLGLQLLHVLVLQLLEVLLVLLEQALLFLG